MIIIMILPKYQLNKIDSSDYRCPLTELPFFSLSHLFDCSLCLFRRHTQCHGSSLIAICTSINFIHNLKFHFIFQENMHSIQETNNILRMRYVLRHVNSSRCCQFYTRVPTFDQHYEQRLSVAMGYDVIRSKNNEIHALLTLCYDVNGVCVLTCVLIVVKCQLLGLLQHRHALLDLHK